MINKLIHSYILQTVGCDPYQVIKNRGRKMKLKYYKYCIHYINIYVLMNLRASSSV